MFCTSIFKISVYRSIMYTYFHSYIWKLRASQVAQWQRIRLPMQEMPMQENPLANAGSSWVRKIPWGRKRQPTPVSLPGKFHGQRCLVGYSPWNHKRVIHGIVTKPQYESWHLMTIQLYDFSQTEYPLGPAPTWKNKTCAPQTSAPFSWSSLHQGYPYPDF